MSLYSNHANHENISRSTVYTRNLRKVFRVVRSQSLEKKIVGLIPNGIGVNFLFSAPNSFSKCSQAFPLSVFDCLQYAKTSENAW